MAIPLINCHLNDNLIIYVDEKALKTKSKNYTFLGNLENDLDLARSSASYKTNIFGA